MKVFILACLVALAFASEESLSVSTENLVDHVEEKRQMVEQMEQLQLQAKDVIQNKVNPFIQSQPEAFPYDQPISCTPFVQNTQPIAQPSLIPSFGPAISPELEAFLKAKATILPKNKASPYHSLETVLSLLNPQTPSLANLANQPNQPNQPNQHIPQSQVQLLAQYLQAFPQTPIVSPQTELSLPQAKYLYFLQQIAPFLQKDMSTQAFLQHLGILLNPTIQLPANQPLYQVTV